MGVAPMYERKARNLMTKIQNHPDILRRTREGEIDINGETISGTNFNELFKSMVGPKPNLNLPGIAQFLGALRQIGVKSTELSGIKLQELYRGAPPKGAPRARLATLRGQQQGIEEEAEDEEDDSADMSFTTPQARRPTLPPTVIPVTKQSSSSSGQSTSKTQQYGALMSKAPDSGASSSKSSNQSGKGYPPGKRPKILYVY